MQRVHEYTGNTNLDWQQEYVYDRYGNRTIHQTNTWGSNIPKPNFGVNTATNQLTPLSGTMTYDPAGNLTTDTYSAAAVTRVYDAENRMTQETQANSYVAGSYSYDGDGHRVRRNIGGVETWQVYGIGGELVAEYPANAPAASPQKEYGYRNGQLLVTATVTSGWGAAPVLHDNPLNPNYPGETTVQARHITELRTAIDALRIHMSMSPYSWQYSVTTNDWITANPILEMRTALDQALGAPSSGYSTGLAQNQLVMAIHIQELRNRVLAAWQSGRKSFAEFLTNRLKSRCRDLGRERSPESFSETNKYISLTEARRLLRITHRDMSDLIATGQVDFVIRNRGTILEYVVRFFDVQNVKDSFERALTTRGLARELGVDCEVIEELAQAGNLQMRWRPAVDGYHTIKYDRDSVQELLESGLIRNAASQPNSSRPKCPAKLP